MRPRVMANCVPIGEQDLLPSFWHWREQISGLHLKLRAVDLRFGGAPPFVLGRIRTQALRLAGVKIGHASAFWGQPTLVGSGNIAERLTVGESLWF